jgi:hypothetical protein
MRQSLGTAVFAGMLGVTAFGLLFTPAFYTVVSKFGHKKLKAAPDDATAASDNAADRDDAASDARAA